jgi:hypothetical protein
MVGLVLFIIQGNPVMNTKTIPADVHEVVHGHLTQDPVHERHNPIVNAGYSRRQLALDVLHTLHLLRNPNNFDAHAIYDHRHGIGSAQRRLQRQGTEAAVKHTATLDEDQLRDDAIATKVRRDW